MRSFGLTGYEYIQNQTHLFCPYINSNCCTEQDQIDTYDIWNNEIKKNIESALNQKLKLFAYLLGNYKDILHIADKLKKEENQ